MEEKRARTQTFEEFEASAAQGHMDAKRELAKRLMEGEGVEKNEAKAASLLEECVALGDAEAMLLLAKWCAHGRGMNQSAERAETLITESAKKGNKEAQSLMEILSDCKGKESIFFAGLCHCLRSASNSGIIFMCLLEYRNKNCTVEDMAVVMNIVPCKSLNMGCETQTTSWCTHPGSSTLMF